MIIQLPIKPELEVFSPRDILIRLKPVEVRFSVQQTRRSFQRKLIKIEEDLLSV